MERGLKFEAIRQTRLLKAGKKVVRETRRFDEERKVTIAARKKETEEDYGYIGEPDLGIFHLREIVEGLDVRETPMERAKRMEEELGVPADTARQIVMTSESLADLTELLCKEIDVKGVIPWIMGPISSRKGALESDYEKYSIGIKKVMEDLSSGEMTDTEARRRLDVLFGEEVEQPVKVGEGLLELVRSLIEENPSIVDDFRENERAANHIIGQVMRTTGGRYSSSEVVETVKGELRARI
jgi:aspartyl-tRNA(Asn)/glutamyl-tRNA(Gln) amidotransferase subunit B